MGRCATLAVCASELRELLRHLAPVVVLAVDTSGPAVGVTARTRDAPVACTGCGAESDWEHSRYVRHLADAAFGDRPVRIDLSVRRLYCEDAACPKVTFAEQVARLTVRYQRRTPVLQRIVQAVGIALAGLAGVRLLCVLHCLVSRGTVLSQLMRVPAPAALTPQALGVDDFALRRDVYGRLRYRRRGIAGPA